MANTTGTLHVPSVGRAMAPPRAFRGPSKHGHRTSQLQFSRYSPLIVHGSAMLVLSLSTVAGIVPPRRRSGSCRQVEVSQVAQRALDPPPQARYAQPRPSNPFTEVPMATAMKTRWQMSGQGYEFCNCDFGCGCNFGGFPNSKDGSCRALVGFTPVARSTSGQPSSAERTPWSKQSRPPELSEKSRKLVR